MPHVSNLVKVTRDSQYIITAGTYNPRLRVYDTNMMSLKYEKIMDSHAIQLVSLEDDYSKVSKFLLITWEVYFQLWYSHLCLLSVFK